VRCKRAGAGARFFVAAPAFFACGQMRIDFSRPPLRRVGLLQGV
jgi:hypothetical protein